MSDPGQGSSIPPDPRRHGGYQYPPVGPPGQFGPPPGQFGPPPGQFGPPPWQDPAASKQPLAARLASTLDSWQKVVLACTALIVAVGGLAAAVRTSHPRAPGGAPQASTTTGPSEIQVPVSTQANGLPAGCHQGLAAIATFEQTNGSTPSSEQNAAKRALDEIGAISDASGAVASDLQNLDNDFQTLFYAALEQNMSNFSVQGQYAAPTKQNSSAFSSELTQINVDSQQLAKDCNSA